MKTILKFLAVTAVLMAVAASAQPRVVATNQNTFREYSLPGTLAVATATNLYTSGGVFLVHPGYDIGIEMSWTNAGSGSLSNVVVWLKPTVDGTNYADAIVSWTLLSSGATAQRKYTNVVHTLFDSAFGVGLVVSNGDAANVIGFTDRKVRLTRAKIVPQ